MEVQVTELQVTVYREEGEKILYRMLPDAQPFRSFSKPSSPKDEVAIIAKSFGIAPGDLDVREHINLDVDAAGPLDELAEEEQPEVQDEPEAPKKGRKK